MFFTPFLSRLSDFSTTSFYSTATAALLACSTLGLTHSAAAHETDAGQPILKVYTYDSFSADWGPGPKLTALFEAECNCKLALVGVTDALNIMTRLRFEGEDSSADAIVGLDNNTIAEAEALELIEPHDVDLTGLNMPIEWTNKNFIPFDYGYFGFVYDKRNSNIDTVPSSFEEFLQQDTTLIIQDPRTSTPGLGLVAWIENIYGDRSDEIWRALNDRIVVISPGWGEAYDLFLQGDGDYVLSYTTSPAYHLIEENDDNYAVAIFDEGHYMQIENAARLTNADHPELANEFLQFLVSPEAQSIIAQSNWMYPAADPNPTLPDNYPTEPAVGKLIFDADEVSRQKSQWLQTWLTALSE